MKTDCVCSICPSETFDDTEPLLFMIRLIDCCSFMPLTALLTLSELQDLLEKEAGLSGETHRPLAGTLAKRVNYDQN